MNPLGWIACFLLFLCRFLVLESAAIHDRFICEANSTVQVDVANCIISNASKEDQSWYDGMIKCAKMPLDRIIDTMCQRTQEDYHNLDMLRQCVRSIPPHIPAQEKPNLPMLVNCIEDYPGFANVVSHYWRS
uniref:Venom protein n=1 Tax=Hadrurus spadix TaxID=141984 RepID=A0A1W7R949_9SCOR